MINQNMDVSTIAGTYTSDPESNTPKPLKSGTSDERSFNWRHEWRGGSIMERGIKYRESYANDAKSKIDAFVIRQSILNRVSSYRRKFNAWQTRNIPFVTHPDSSNALRQFPNQTSHARETYNKRSKVNLAEEVFKLSKYGWYWGHISQNEADATLKSKPDGAFLVRDALYDRYILTISFKSDGRIFHALWNTVECIMEYTGQSSAFYDKYGNHSIQSIDDLINHCENVDQSGCRFNYPRPSCTDFPKFRIRLNKPVNRFTQIRSLQYLCRSVIRTRLYINNRPGDIDKLPLPRSIKKYLY